METPAAGRAEQRGAGTGGEGTGTSAPARPAAPRSGFGGIVQQAVRAAEKRRAEGTHYRSQGQAAELLQMRLSARARSVSVTAHKG